MRFSFCQSFKRSVWTTFRRVDNLMNKGGKQVSHALFTGNPHFAHTRFILYNNHFENVFKGAAYLQIRS